MITPALQNLLHVPAYLVLSVLTLYAGISTDSMTLRRVIALLVLCLAYGALLEWLQANFIPGRFGSLADIFLNTLGIVIGACLWLAFGRQSVATTCDPSQHPLPDAPHPLSAQPRRPDSLVPHAAVSWRSERTSTWPASPRSRWPLKRCRGQTKLVPRWKSRRLARPVGCAAPGRWFGGRSITEGLFRSPRLRRRSSMVCETSSFDAVLVLCSSMFQFAPRPVDNVLTVVDLIDVDSQKWLDYAHNARGLKRLLFKLESRRVRQLESRVACNGRRRHAGQRARGRPVSASRRRGQCPRGDQRRRYRPLPAGPSPDQDNNPHECVFVGVLDYRANVEGLRWFCREVWPEVRRRVSGRHVPHRGPATDEAVLRLADFPASRWSARWPTSASKSPAPPRRGPAASRPRHPKQSARGPGDGQARRRHAAGPGGHRPATRPTRHRGHHNFQLDRRLRNTLCRRQPKPNASRWAGRRFVQVPPLLDRLPRFAAKPPRPARTLQIGPENRRA